MLGNNNDNEIAIIFNTSIGCSRIIIVCKESYVLDVIQSTLQLNYGNVSTFNVLVQC